MPGVYPNYIPTLMDTQYDIPDRLDIWNGSYSNDMCAQLVMHQALLAGIQSNGVVRNVWEINNNPATVSINTNLYNIVNITGQTQGVTLITTTGSQPDGATLRISITGTTSVPFTLDPSTFEQITILFPTTTLGTSRLDMGFLWDISASKWKIVAVC
jgi:hypothetical protein